MKDGGAIMNDYVIMTDSSCDLPASLAEKMELTVLPLFVYVDDKKYTNYLDEREIAFSEIYAKLRTKCPAKTAAANMNDFLAAMDEILKSGRDSRKARIFAVVCNSFLESSGCMWRSLLKSRILLYSSSVS